jgi:hypothetical protein
MECLYHEGLALRKGEKGGRFVLGTRGRALMGKKMMDVSSEGWIANRDAGVASHCNRNITFNNQSVY